MESLVPLLLVAGVSSGFLYASSKKRKQGFQDVVDPGYVQNAASRFNPMMNLVNPANNPFFTDGARQADINKQTRTIRQALQTPIATPSDPSFSLAASDRSDIKINTGSGGIGSQGIKACEKIKTVNCDAFDDPNFAYTCGICHEGGKDSGGNPSLGGLFITEDDRLDAESDAKRMNSRRVNYTPSVGQCAPNRFTTTKEQCIRLKKQMECEAKQSFTVEGCSQCYQDETFKYIDKDVLKGAAPQLVLVGSGSVTLSTNKSEGKLLSKIPYRTSIHDFSEGNIIQLYISQDISPESVKIAGYLEGHTASGTFTIDIARLVQTDLVSGQKPRMAGMETIHGNNYTLLRPAMGKNTMILPIQNVFTFIDPSEQEAIECSASPYITKQSSAEFLNSGPCFKKGQQPGNYSLECLQTLFENAGCDGKGAGYPGSAEKAKALMTGEDGRNLSAAEIAGKVYDMSQIAYTGQKEGRKLTLREWDQATNFCNGKRIFSPCDGDNKESGPLSADCLAYLWLNKGATDGNPGGVGPTYTNSVRTASLDGAENKYCTAIGTMSPINANGNYNYSIIEYTNRKGGVNAVKEWYNQIHMRANDNTLPDEERKEAIIQCYGIDLKPPPSQDIGGKVGSTANAVPSVLDYKPGRTKSAMEILNYPRMDWSRYSKPVAVLAPYGKGPWGKWWSPNFPSDGSAYWIWTFASAINDEPSWSPRQFYKRWYNDTKKPITATLTVAADNQGSVYVNDNVVSSSFAGTQTWNIVLPPGESKIQINANNQGGPAGVLAIARANGKTLFSTDASWTTSAI